MKTIRIALALMVLAIVLNFAFPFWLHVVVLSETPPDGRYFIGTGPHPSPMDEMRIDWDKTMLWFLFIAVGGTASVLMSRKLTACSK